jgi:hypothetical protein
MLEYPAMPKTPTKPLKILVRGFRFSYTLQPKGAGWTVLWRCLEPGCQRSWSESVADRRDAENRANESMVAHGLEAHTRRS